MSVPYYGDFPAGATVYIPFNTFTSDDPSASVTMTNFVNTDVHIHKNLGLTQRNNAAGVTVDVDVDAIAGGHGVTIDTSDNTVADFWTSGADYQVRIEGVTVDGGTLNVFIGSFSLENRMVAGYLVSTTIATLASQTSFTLTAGSADNDAYNNCLAIVTDIASAVQKCIGRISDYVGATKTVTLAADPGIFTMAAKDRISIVASSALANVSSVGGTAQTANDDGADINAIKTKTDSLTFTVANQVDANAVAVSGVAATADRLEAWMNGFLTGTVEEGGGPTTTVFQTDAGEATDNHFNNSIIVFTGGALLGQARRISDYTAATGTMTVEPALTEAPSAGDTWIVFPMVIGGIDANGRVDVGRVAGTAQTANDNGADINAILVDTGTTLQAELDGIQADTEDIQSRLPAALVSGRMSSDAVAISGSTDAADKLEASAETIVIGTVSWDNTNATTTVIYSDDVTEATADHYNGRIMIFTSGDLTGQATDVTDYALDTGEGKFTVTALTEAPADNVTFVLV
jgi:hypothetical protein